MAGGSWLDSLAAEGIRYRGRRRKRREVRGKVEGHEVQQGRARVQGTHLADCGRSRKFPIPESLTSVRRRNRDDKDAHQGGRAHAERQTRVFAIGDVGRRHAVSHVCGLSRGLIPGRALFGFWPPQQKTAHIRLGHIYRPRLATGGSDEARRARNTGSIRNVVRFEIPPNDRAIATQQTKDSDQGHGLTRGGLSGPRLWGIRAGE